MEAVSHPDVLRNTELNYVADDSVKVSTLIMQVCCDNLTPRTLDLEGKAKL